MSQELLSLLDLRERVGRPARAERQISVSHFTPIVRHFPDRLTGETAENTFQYMKNVKSYLENTGLAAPRSMLCATVLDKELLTAYLSWAREGYQRGDLSYFRFWFDFSWGVSNVWRVVQEAVDEIDRTPDESNEFVSMVASQAQEILGAGEPVLVETAMELRINRLLEARTLIQDDPRGFSLVEVYVTKFRKTPEELILPTQVKEYTLLGAEVARDLYKKVYGMAKPLYH